jgi:hypothetical protein
VLFARDAGKGRSGEFFLWKRGADEPWPNPCTE